jgi:hypothetical protein
MTVDQQKENMWWFCFLQGRASQEPDVQQDQFSGKRSAELKFPSSFTSDVGSLLLNTLFSVFPDFDLSFCFRP